MLAARFFAVLGKNATLYSSGIVLHKCWNLARKSCAIRQNMAPAKTASKCAGAVFYIARSTGARQMSESGRVSRQQYKTQHTRLRVFDEFRKYAKMVVFVHFSLTVGTAASKIVQIR